MQGYFKTIVALLAGVQIATCMLVGGFQPVQDLEEARAVAEKAIPQLVSVFGPSQGCYLKLKNIFDARSQVVAGTNFLFELEIEALGQGCPTDVKVCKNIKVFRPLPHVCGNNQNCLSLSETERISCIPSIIVEPPQFLVGGYSQIPRPNNDERIKKIASEAVKFLYHKFNTEQTACPIQVNDITKAEEQLVAGYNYKFDLQIETLGIDFNCEYVLKSCTGVEVYEPLDHQCHTKDRPCLIPTNLDKVKCFEIKLPGPIIEEEYFSIEDPSNNRLTKDVADKAVNYFHHKFNHTKACPIQIKEINSASMKLGNEVEFKMDLQIETLGVLFDCEYVILSCSNVHLHEYPPEKCPKKGEEHCIVPVNLQDVKCVEVIQIRN